MMMDKTLRYVIFSGLFLIPFTFLIVTSSLYFPYISGKNFLFRALVEIILICYTALAFRKPAYRPNWRNPITIALVIFTVVIFLADIFGVNFYHSFWSNYERMEGFITFIHLLALFLVSTIVLDSEPHWKRFFHIVFLVSFIMGCIGLYQHFHNNIDRIDAQLGNSTYLGALTLFNIFLLLFYLFRSIRERRRPHTWAASGYGFLILFNAWILYLTGTRGAFLGALVGVFFIAIILAIFERNQKSIRIAGITLLILGVLGLGFLVTFRNSPIVQNNTLLARFAAPVNAVLTLDIKKFAETEGKGRLLIWQAAIKGFQERPILGWGEENFNYVFNKYYDPAMYGQEQWFDRSHNVILDWLTQGGILGLLAYLSLFIGVLYVLWHRSRNNLSLEDRAVLTGLLIAYFIHNFFVFDNITSYILFFSILSYVNWKQPRRTPKKVREPANIHPDIANYALVPIVIIVVATGFYFGVWAPYRAGHELIIALKAQQSIQANPTDSGQLTKMAFSSFHRSLSYKSFGRPEIREQLLEFVPVALASDADAQTKNGVVTLAKTEIEEQFKATPNDARYYLFYGYSLDRLHSYEESETYLKKALSLSPQKQAIKFELGLNYLSRGMNAEGLAILKDAYLSAPDYPEAKINYAIGLIYNGKSNEANDILKDVDLSVYGSRLMKAYYDAKQYNQLIGLYHQKMVKDPSDPQNYLGAAAFQMVLKNRPGAILELQKLISYLTANPAAGASSTILIVKDYINQIKAGKNPLSLSSNS